MCAGLFSAPRMPAPPPTRQNVAPTVKAAQKAPEYVEPEKLKEDTGDEDVVDTKKKKALEIKKTKEGVKQFSAIDAKSMPQGPEGGFNL